jgi:MOSC domain-containing protein YiiM
VHLRGLIALGARLRLGRHRPAPQLVAIYIAPAAGAAMQRVDSAQAIAGAGLSGDRYATDRGHWRALDGCQVTLIVAEDLARAERRTGLVLQHGAHRRNLVVAGAERIDLWQARLRIGEVVLEWQRIRPPCGYLDQIAGRGMAKALGRRAGHCYRVIEGGRLRVSDPIEFLS